MNRLSNAAYTLFMSCARLQMKIALCKPFHKRIQYRIAYIFNKALFVYHFFFLKCQRLISQAARYNNIPFKIQVV